MSAVAPFESRVDAIVQGHAAVEYEPDPALLRSDGEPLLRRGRLHLLHGESDAGKSWLTALATKHALEAPGSRPVFYFGWDGTEDDLGVRLGALGLRQAWNLTPVWHASTRERLEWLRAQLADCRDGYEEADREEAALGPPEPPEEFERSDWRALVVLDGVTEAMAADGLDVNDNAAAARWLGGLPTAALTADATVVLVHNVTKDARSRGRHGLGAQQFTARADLVYSVRRREFLGPERVGRSAVAAVRDRIGCGRDATLVLDGTDPARPRLELLPPDEKASAAAREEAAHELWDGTPKTETELAREVIRGNAARARETASRWIRDGRVVVVGERNRAPLYGKPEDA